MFVQGIIGKSGLCGISGAVLVKKTPAFLAGLIFLFLQISFGISCGVPFESSIKKFYLLWACFTPQEDVTKKEGYDVKILETWRCFSGDFL